MTSPTPITPPPSENPLTDLRGLTRAFVSARDWDKFHTSKNLATALCVEAAELLEPFQWLKTGSVDELSPEKQVEIRHEIADVFLYLVMLADKMDVDLFEAAKEKIAINEIKYPAERVRGDARKYNEYK